MCCYDVVNGMCCYDVVNGMCCYDVVNGMCCYGLMRVNLLLNCDEGKQVAKVL